MKSSSVNRSHKGVVQKAASSVPTAESVRQACDEFIEIRREHVNFGKNRLVGGFATIGRHSALILIHGENGRRGKSRIPKSVRGRASGFLKADHLIQLAHKFKKPIVVCFVAPASSSGLIPAEPHEALGLPKHILSQWYLDVPIVLVILTSKSAYDIFGVWLADKSLALDQTRFILALQDQGRNRRFEVDAKTLARGGIIDKTISVSRNFSGPTTRAIPSRLRNALIQMLDEVAGDSPEDLKARRLERLARVEAMVANMCGRAQ
jgi:acetyl-CoA carboxylase alpha subunit